MRSASVATITAPWASMGQLRSWPLRRWVAALIFTAAAAVALGVPTGILPSSLYHRMTSVTWWDYPVWGVSSVLAGLTAATYVLAPVPSAIQDTARRSTLATLGSLLAVGCPICNKIVVAVLGVSGALSYWAPVQPVLGLASIALLSAGLLIRLNGERQCAVNSAG